MSRAVYWRESGGRALGGELGGGVWWRVGWGLRGAGPLRECWGGLKVDMSGAQWDTHSAARVRCGGWVRASGGDDMGRRCDFSMGTRRSGEMRVGLNDRGLMGECCGEADGARWAQRVEGLRGEG